MANLLQGAPLPTIQTTQTNVTTAPDWYSSFLSSLPTQGQQAAQQGGVAPMTPEQLQAINLAGTVRTAGAPQLQTATQAATSTATTPAYSVVDQYMNPYTSSVVNEIGRLGTKQFNELLAPGATAGAVGSGQFGSTRGMQVYGNVARDVAQNILGQQTGALEAGYKSALSAAQQDALLRNQAAQVLGALSGQAQAQDIAGINALQQQGALAQAQRQAELNYPMGALSNIAGLIRGFQIPTTQTQTFRGPGQQGNYQLSPLAQVAGVLGTTGQGLTNLNQLLGGTTGQNAFSNIFNAIKGGLGLNSTSAPTNISAPTGLTQVTNAADGSSIFWDPYSQSYVDSSGNFADVSFEG